MEVGQKIKALRIDCGLTQEEFANKIFVSRDLISKWENGTRRPDYKTVKKIAEIFSVTEEEITEKNEILINELSDCIPENFNIKNLNDALNEFLINISERDRCIFIRRYYYMDEVEEISEKFGISANHIYTILMRTRKKLRKFLGKENGR